MITLIPRHARRLLVSLAAAAALAGCVYQPLPPPPPQMAYAAPPAPPPAYYYPGYAYAPGYYGPPVVGSVNLGFGYWGGHRHWH